MHAVHVPNTVMQEFSENNTP